MIESFFQEIIRIYNSEHPFMALFSEIWQAFLSFWNYKIFVTTDKQAVLVSNVVLGLILFAIGTKFVKRLTAIFKTKLTHINLEDGVLNSL